MIIKRIILSLLLCISLCAYADASPIRGGSSSIGATCIYNASNAGSCLIDTNTTNTLTATDPTFTSSSIPFSFNVSTLGAINLNGSLKLGYFASCPGLEGDPSGYAANACYQSAYLKACVTGGVPTNPPYWDMGFVSWNAVGNIIYNSRNDGTSFYSGLPAFTPSFTFYDTSASLSRRGAGQFPAFMTGLCGTPTYTDFINSLAGNMADLNTALLTLRTGESVEVKAAPSPIPYWPSNDNNIGPTASNGSPPHDITVNLDSGVNIAYAVVSKGVLAIENNGTTINGNDAWVYWVQPGGSGGNQSCVAWDAGLDLTINDLNCNMAPMGIVRADIRSGITTFNNVMNENNGCEDGSCTYGHNHNTYLGTTEGAGFDTVNATNLFNPDVQERGWNLKLRPPNSNIMQSAFIARVNNGASSPHGAIDFPCGGTHTISYTAFETNQFSHSSSGNQTSFIIETGEETATNTTTGGGNPTAGNNCPVRMWLPSGGPLTGTVTSTTTFTTTTDPATVFPYQIFGPGYGLIWDEGASGLMENGPANVISWTGPVTGVYTVSVGNCFSGEGTLPLAQGVPVYSCFNASSGSVTLYAQNAVTLATNTPTTASITTSVDPRGFGLFSGDTVFDNSGNPVSITSITGTGPFTIALSCGVASSSGNCFDPTRWEQTSGPLLPTSVDFIEKAGPVEPTASTSGTGCDGANLLCGVANNPAGWLIGPGMGVYGTHVAAGCVLAGKIGSIQPVTGTGTGYANGDHVTVAGGVFETAAVFAVASNTGGVPTSYTIVSGGIYTALPKTFTQGSTTGSGTGAQLHFPYPQAIIGGSGSNWTLLLAQASGANCITGSTTNAVYQMLTPTIINFDHDLVIWDGVSPNGGCSAVIAFATGTACNGPSAFQSCTATNGVYFADQPNGITWGSGSNNLALNCTDGGGNVFCQKRNDPTTSARCAVPDFTTANFTGSIVSGNLLAPSGASTCKPGMYIWDDQGEFNITEPGYTIGGTRIKSGGPTSFVLYFPTGGVSTLDVPSGPMHCGWGTPSAAFNATIASGGIMTINSGLAGSIHVNDYEADISGGLPDNVQVTGAIDSTHWQTNYSGAGVSAEYMVSVR